LHDEEYLVKELLAMLHYLMDFEGAELITNLKKFDIKIKSQE
jgi:hypothetical protein